jgi:hypothetical protein
VIENIIYTLSFAGGADSIFDGDPGGVYIDTQSGEVIARSVALVLLFSSIWTNWQR